MGKSKIVIYTAVAGNYDHPVNHVKQDIDIDYIYFTDGASRPEQDWWEVVTLPSMPKLDNRRKAKLPKIYPHFFSELTSYDCSIWIDGDMEILNPHFAQEILSFLNNGIVISPHFDARDCAYGESTIRPYKYKYEPIDEQVEYYRREDFPEHYGLYECGVMARDMTNDKVKELGLTWMNHNLLFSYQDQISLPYCLWQMNYQPDVLPTSFREFNWVHINAHRSEA